MRIAISLLLAVFMSIPCGVSANFIGLYADGWAASCMIYPDLYWTTRVYVIAGSSLIDGAMGAEFGSDPLDFTNLAIATPHWSSPLVKGDLLKDQGMSIAWTEPVSGPLIQIGYIDYFVLQPFPNDLIVSILPHPDTGRLVIIDEDDNQISAWGMSLCINDLSGGCHPCFPAVQESSWGEIKALY